MRNLHPFSTFFLFIFLFLPLLLVLVHSYDGPLYDYTAHTECKLRPEKPLYNGGILKNQALSIQSIGDSSNAIYSPAFLLHNLTARTYYSFSSWVKLGGAVSSVVRASLRMENETYNCIGTVLAKHGCWSFLKGGFFMNLPSNFSILFFQIFDEGDANISIDNASLQPFTEEEWRVNQQLTINSVRKRAVTVHVSDKQGGRLEGALINVKQISKDFAFGSAIAKSIIGNLPYQDWFVKRFNAAVFENELKWYATEPKPGVLNYTTADRMLEFVRANQITARGHNIFWEDPKYTPLWVQNLTGEELKSAVDSRIKGLLSRYKDEFIHWDVSNEMLHFDFYEKSLGANATLHFYKTAHEIDPLATLFMNEFNVVETCSDVKSTVDNYINRLKELKRNGVSMDGIGLEGHFTIPNPPLMRAILDKLATLNLPIWLTEVDISHSLGQETQASYLEVVLREGFSHPAVGGILLWSALDPNGCYQMCLTDANFKNLPTGDVVDKLLKEWKTGDIEARTDNHGSFSFYGFLGEYEVSVKYDNRSAASTFPVSVGDETKHFSIQL
ncbi:endo-1,4-beta-xylanase 5 isoform X1 [Cucumis sativus]|uniref:GH10 domain-containing protein n=1 Tax=Cucumis sativus TaxID=3659 RepID=A0A0A0LJE7_CUCSA|nr:endo-1,4-beta-xylanase 5 isoform X1 [Cucumis sativus]KGN61918.1 hypothetical protein Csa_006083 [Cucumis sativus]